MAETQKARSMCQMANPDCSHLLDDAHTQIGDKIIRVTDNSLRKISDASVCNDDSQDLLFQATCKCRYCWETVLKHIYVGNGFVGLPSVDQVFDFFCVTRKDIFAIPITSNA